MDPHITWSQPDNPAHARAATWEGRLVFAMVCPSGRGPRPWLVALYPSGHTAHARNIYAASKAQGKRFIEQWARANPQAIGRPPPQPVATYH